MSTLRRIRPARSLDEAVTEIVRPDAGLRRGDPCGTASTRVASGPSGTEPKLKPILKSWSRLRPAATTQTPAPGRAWR